jgi:hypothetical protein
MILGVGVLAWSTGSQEKWSEVPFPRSLILLTHPQQHPPYYLEGTTSGMFPAPGAGRSPGGHRPWGSAGSGFLGGGGFPGP